MSAFEPRRAAVLIDGTGHAQGLRRRFCSDVLPLAGQLYNRARCLTDSAADAEDLAQETLLRAYAAFESFQTGTSLRAWLFTILKHTWIDQYRAAQRRPAERLTDQIRDVCARGHTAGAAMSLRSAEAEVLDDIPDDRLVEALRRLPPASRTVIYLADVHGLCHQEIALLMNTSTAAVTSRLHRVRRKLRESLTVTSDTDQLSSAAP